LKGKKWGKGTSKQYTDSSQEFHGIFSWNRDQRFGAEIVSPSHQGFQRSLSLGASRVTIASYLPIVQ